MVQILFQDGATTLTYRTRVNGTLAEMTAQYVGTQTLIHGVYYTINSITPTRYRDGLAGPESPTNPITQAIFHIS
jgi:hypothetical protein